MTAILDRTEGDWQTQKQRRRVCNRFQEPGCEDEGREMERCSWKGKWVEGRVWDVPGAYSNGYGPIQMGMRSYKVRGLGLDLCFSNLVNHQNHLGSPCLTNQIGSLENAGNVYQAGDPEELIQRPASGSHYPGGFSKAITALAVSTQSYWLERLDKNLPSQISKMNSLCPKTKPHFIVSGFVLAVVITRCSVRGILPKLLFF